MLASAMTLAVAWAGWSTWRAFGARGRAASTAAPAGAPASWRVDGDALVVLDASGRTCWTRQLQMEVDAGFYAGQVRAPAATGGVGDIDHDGRREVWIIVVQSGKDATHAALHLFNEDGTSRGDYQHAGTATFGRATCGGHWVVHRAFITKDPEAPGRHALWVSSRDVSEYPSLLVRLDIATGTPVSGPYWSNGWVNPVALLDATDIAGAAPAERSKYRCTTCPPGEPLAVAVFPKPRRFASSAGGGGVDALSGGGAAAPILATVTCAVVPAGIAAATVFRLDTALRALQADPADGYRPTCEQLVRGGTIPAFGPLANDPASELLPLLRWDRAAQRYVKTPLQAPAK